MTYRGLRALNRTAFCRGNVRLCPAVLADGRVSERRMREHEQEPHVERGVVWRAKGRKGIGMASPQGDSRLGSTFGPYELTELIGIGGMGEVYRAFDTVRERM